MGEGLFIAGLLSVFGWVVLQLPRSSMRSASSADLVVPPIGLDSCWFSGWEVFSGGGIKGVRGRGKGLDSVGIVSGLSSLVIVVGLSLCSMLGVFVWLLCLLVLCWGGVTGVAGG